MGETADGIAAMLASLRALRDAARHEQDMHAGRAHYPDGDIRRDGVLAAASAIRSQAIRECIQIVEGNNANA